jgi:hypothetical protein
MRNIVLIHYFEDKLTFMGFVGYGLINKLNCDGFILSCFLDIILISFSTKICQEKYFTCRFLWQMSMVHGIGGQNLIRYATVKCASCSKMLFINVNFLRLNCKNIMITTVNLAENIMK